MCEIKALFFTKYYSAYKKTFEMLIDQKKKNSKFFFTLKSISAVCCVHLGNLSGHFLKCSVVVTQKGYLEFLLSNLC